MQSYDVIVVGGGPAGSSCARALVSAGLRTLVLDRAQFPRDKTCAGWITPAVAQTLGLSLSAYAREHVLQPIRGFRVARAGRRGVDVDFERPISFAIRRCEFDHHLLKRCGADLRLGKPLGSLVQTGDGWELDGELRARAIVGAGGNFCPVARHLGSSREVAEPVVTARELEIELGEDELQAYAPALDRPELYFERDLAGYGWIVRKQGWVNIGLGRQEPGPGASSFNRELERFLDELVRLGRIPARPRGSFRGHAYLLYGQGRRKPSGDRALLVGDALGMARVHSGEGILPAVESGILAARALTAAWPNPTPASLARYDATLEKRFGHRTGRLTRPWIPGSLRRCIADGLLSRAGFARHVVVGRWFLDGPRPLA